MPRTPVFKVVNDLTKGWRVNVPAPLSEKGKRQQRFFTTREEANDFAKGLRTRNKDFGSQARNLNPTDTGDAVQALALLRDFNVTLTQCARAYVELHDRRSKAPTLAQAFESGIERRRNLSERSVKNLKGLKRRLPSDFIEFNLVDLAGPNIQAALEEISSGSTAFRTNLRLLSSILGDYSKQGVLHENPCKRVQLPKTRSSDEVTIYTVQQLSDLFIACRDYPDGKDRKCAACGVPFAFLAFAGLRPKELERLRWEDVNIEESHIRISGNISKTGKTRIIRIHKALLVWIETIPASKRIGKITPSRWIQRAGRVKKEAGLDGKVLQDALRHSFGSYLFAVENDIDKLKKDMGHGHKEVFFNFYHKAVSYEKALPYWNIKPI